MELNLSVKRSYQIIKYSRRIINVKCENIGLCGSSRKVRLDQNWTVLQMISDKSFVKKKLNQVYFSKDKKGPELWNHLSHDSKSEEPQNFEA